MFNWIISNFIDHDKSMTISSLETENVLFNGDHDHKKTNNNFDNKCIDCP
jgi:hypothetical protein